MTISSVRFSIIDQGAELAVKKYTDLTGNDPLTSLVQTSQEAMKGITDFLSKNIDLPSFELPDNPLSDLGKQLGFSFDDIKPSFFSDSMNSSTYGQCMSDMNSSLDPLGRSNGLMSSLIPVYPTSQSMMSRGSSPLSLGGLLSQVNSLTGTGTNYNSSQSMGMLGNLMKVVNAGNSYGLYGVNNYMNNNIQNPTIGGQLTALSLMSAISRKDPLAVLDACSSRNVGYARTSYPNVTSDIIRELTLPKRLNESSYDRYSRILETSLSRTNPTYQNQIYNQTSSDYRRLYGNTNNYNYNTQNRTCTMTPQEAQNAARQAEQMNMAPSLTDGLIYT